MHKRISEVFDFEKGEQTPFEQEILKKLEHPDDQQQYKILIANRHKLLTELCAIEEQILTTVFNPSTLKSKYDRVNEISNMVQWLNGVEGNRFIKPLQQLEANKKIHTIPGFKAEA